MVFSDIPKYKTFTKIEPITKGWSSDKKHCVETASGERLLLRVSDIAEYERKLAEFKMLKRVAEFYVPTSRPVNFGICDDGKSVYQLLMWIDVKDLESALPTLSEAEQYALGIKSGEILQSQRRQNRNTGRLDSIEKLTTKSKSTANVVCALRVMNMSFPTSSKIVTCLKIAHKLCNMAITALAI
jgi:aminoglycoside phosphotransferase (APT) family kinase protein